MAAKMGDSLFNILVKSEKYFDILNRLGVAHEWDGQTDRPLALIACSIS